MKVTSLFESAPIEKAGCIFLLNLSCSKILNSVNNFRSFIFQILIEESLLSEMILLSTENNLYTPSFEKVFIVLFVCKSRTPSWSYIYQQISFDPLL